MLFSEGDERVLETPLLNVRKLCGPGEVGQTRPRPRATSVSSGSSCELQRLCNHARTPSSSSRNHSRIPWCEDTSCLLVLTEYLNLQPLSRHTNVSSVLTKTSCSRRLNFHRPFTFKGSRTTRGSITNQCQSSSCVVSHIDSDFSHRSSLKR